MFNNFFLIENRAVYEIMWKNIVEPDRLQVTIWRMRIACWTPKTKNTHSQYVIIFAFPLQHWLHERAAVSRYTYIGCYTTTAGRNTAMRAAVTPRKQLSAILRFLVGGRNYADLKFSVADSCWHCVLSCQHEHRYVAETELDSPPTCKVIMTSHIKYAYIKL